MRGGGWNGAIVGQSGQGLVMRAAVDRFSNVFARLECPLAGLVSPGCPPEQSSPLRCNAGVRLEAVAIF